MKALKTNRNRGFTIVELMIATSVLSVILLLATAVMLNIGAIYYKGDNQARVEDSTRAALDSVTQDIQFSENQAVFNSRVLSSFNEGAYPQTAYAFCMKSANYEFRYSFVGGIKIGSGGFSSSDPSKTQINHVFWRDVIDWDSPCTPANLDAPNPETMPPNPAITDFNTTGRQGTELVPPDSRLLDFCISPVNGWPGCAGSPTSGNYTVSVGIAYGDVSLSPNGTCIGGTGDQFCATDSLTSSITSRL